MLLQRADNALSDFKFYYYVPNLAAAVIFIILFLISTLLHFYQMIRTRTWFMVPFCIGCAFEFVGYIGRALSHSQAPDYTIGPYVIQSILLLVAPALLAASIYMELGRIVLLVNGEKALFIRRTWLTKLFVSGDVLSFLVQSTGGGLMAGGSSSSVNLGKTLVLVGLVLQVIYFGLFVLSGAVFHLRMRQHPTEKASHTPWQKHMLSLYLVSILIFIRSIVRVVEYGQGFDGYIITHEVFLYIFDATPMFLAVATMNVIHPSEVGALIRGGKASKKVIFMEDVV